MIFNDQLKIILHTNNLQINFLKHKQSTSQDYLK